jgi:hypothetical protein
MMLARGIGLAIALSALAPAPPFPALIASSVERTEIAPGIALNVYRLRTAAGPLVVSVVTADPHDPRVAVGTVLAHDTIVSADERVSSMAKRTHAVAGINGDYFDINATGAPVGMLVRDGTLLRSPSARVALTLDGNGELDFGRFTFSGSVTTPRGTFAIGALNVWPAPGTLTLLTPAFGTSPLPPATDVVALAPAAAGDAASANTTAYQIVPSGTGPPPALRIARGAGVPAIGTIGDVVTVAMSTLPPIDTIRSAIGGGPLLIDHGAVVDDPASPNYATRARRIPVAAVAKLADGTLALVTVDGHRVATSIGIARSELCALLLALGATDAMLLDSGGSATLVARAPGDVDASVVNDPSDGVERPVADGLFLYSATPLGPPARLTVRPQQIVALAGAVVPLRARIVDASDHPLGDATGPWTLDAPRTVAAIDTADRLHVGERTGTYALAVARGGVHATLPLTIVPHVARLVIGPAQANPDPHGTIALGAAAYDEDDRPVAIGGVVHWSARGGSIDADGRFTAGTANATVTAAAGGVVATATIPVGRHPEPLALVDVHRPSWHLVTVPANGSGGVDDSGGRIALSYDFSAGERAAYAIGDVPLGAPLALSCAVDGDANGEALRATLVDRYGDRETATFVRALTFDDTRRLTIAIGPALAPPVVLHALYVVGTLANPALTAAGTIVVHDCTVTVPGF